MYKERKIPRLNSSACGRAWLGCVVLGLLLQACASGPPSRGPDGLAARNIGNYLPEDEPLRQTLYRQQQAWAGTPYRYGGLDRDGVDCSGLVYRTFHEKFGLLLPRTTHGQAKSGTPVTPQELRAGDLVFFRTGGKNLHVGIYIEDTRFLHASTSEGVIVSDLRNPYWAGHYWQARRIRSLR